MFFKRKLRRNFFFASVLVEVSVEVGVVVENELFLFLFFIVQEKAEVHLLAKHSIKSSLSLLKKSSMQIRDKDKLNLVMAVWF